jgi:hypothetical protein
MSVTITFRYKTEHERTENKHDDSFFLSGETESLPEMIECETPAPFQLAKSPCAGTRAAFFFAEQQLLIISI